MVNVKQNTGRKTGSFALDNSFIRLQLSNICKAIKTSNSFIDGKNNLSEKILAALLSDLRAHYEMNYGKNSAKPRPITIPSARLFADYSINGPIHVILNTLLEGATVRDLLPIENMFSNSAQAILPILYDIDKKLTTSGLHYSPAIFVNKAPVGQINKLSKIVLEHGGKIVSTEDKATHIVDWNDDIDSNQSFSEDANRLVQVVGGNDAADGTSSFAQIHWTFFPDSYDEFVPMEVVGNLNEMTDAQNLFGVYILKTKYYVSCRFILDCDFFNEWGNEMDYEYNPSEDDDNLFQDSSMGSSKRLKTKRKSNMGSSNAMTSKKDASVPPTVNGSFPAASDKVFFPEVFPQSLANLSSGSSTTLDITTNPPILLQSSQVESKQDADNSILGKRPVESMNNKDETSWYAADRVSELEKRYLSYLIQESTASSFSSYITVRNSIVSFYLQNPTQYLTATECRRKVAGDISKIVRIHEFLDAFGIINHLVKLEQRPIYGFEMLDDMSKSLKKKALLENMIKHYPSYSVSQSVSKQPSPTGNWTVEMDNMLLSLISSRKKDWRSIAAEMEKMFAVTLVQCMMRFLEMPISVTASLVENEAILNETMNTNGSEKPIAVGQDIISKGISTCKDEVRAKLQQAFELIQAFEKIVVELKFQQTSRADSQSLSPSKYESQNDISHYEDMALQLREELKKHITSQIRIISERIEKKVEDYTDMRLHIMENKLNVFEHVENVLILEKEQLDADKHDFIASKLSQGIFPTTATIHSSSSFSNLALIK